MIEPNDIVEHLQNYLPAFTDLFSTKITGATATVSGTTVTVTTPSAHGLLVGENIVVGGGKFENDILSVTDNGDGTLTFTTTYDHDLTEPRYNLDVQTLVLDGIGAPWDGEHRIELVPNRRTFEIEYPTGEIVPPNISTAVLLEDRLAGVIGSQEILTVPTTTTFTFQASNVPNFPTGTLQDLVIVSGVRIAGAENIDRAEAFYTLQATNNAWCFLIMTDAFASKDRNTLNDAIAAFSPQNLGKQTIIQEFSVVVFLPTDENDAAGFAAQNLFYSEIYRSLLSCLYGFRFDDPYSAMKYVTVTNGHGAGRQTTAYSSHVYEFQIPSVITFENGFLLQPDVAFRDIVSNWFNNNDDKAVMGLDIDLDDEPI